MRILSLSHRLTGQLVDNHHIFNAPTVADYKAIVVDVGGVANTIQNAVDASESYSTFADLPVINGTPADGVTGIAASLKRRSLEFTAALEGGAVIIIFAHPPMAISGVSGFQGLDRYFFLPAPTGLSWDEHLLQGGAGTTFSISEPEHPTVDLLETYRRTLLYRCFFDERTTGFAGNARVIARSEGGLPIAAEFSVLNGRIIFLPPPRDAGSSIVSDESKVMVETFRALLGNIEEYPPVWAAKVDIPGLSELTQEQELRRAAFDQAATDLTNIDSALSDLARIREVLWRTGDLGLGAAVIRCAELIGFKATESARETPLLNDGNRDLHYVIAGAEEAVGMGPHYRLRARLDQIIDSELRVPRGLIVANGQRLTRPEERQRDLSESLVIAAESVGYAVVNARSLFDAAIAVLNGLSDEKQALLRDRLFEVDGVVDFTDLLLEPQHSTNKDVSITNTAT